MSKHKKKPQTGGVTRVKAACGHLVSYPSSWDQLVKIGRGYITIQDCPCGYGHVIVVQKSGRTILTTNNPARAVKAVDSLPIQELVWIDPFGVLSYRGFNENDAEIIQDFIDRFSEIPPPNTEDEKIVADKIREFYARLFN